LAFGTYFIGFAARPIGAAIFGHYGDRIGRKATLIATLLCMGIATFLVALVSFNNGSQGPGGRPGPRSRLLTTKINNKVRWHTHALRF
jgi:MFS family permease